MSDQSSTNGKGDGSAPSLTMLIKLMKLTTSSNDNESLLALRKANEQVAKFGGDWETILKGKITVIGDPFADAPPMPQRTTNYGTPNPPPRRSTTPPPPPHRPSAQPAAGWGQPAASAAPPRPRAASSQHRGRVRTNMFSGPCVKCTNHVPEHTGYAVTETPFNRKTKGWEVICDPCYAKATGGPANPSPKAQTGHISDLA